MTGHFRQIANSVLDTIGQTPLVTPDQITADLDGRILAKPEGITPNGYLTVSSGDAIECTRRLAKEEGIFAGYSSGANLAAALALLQGPLPGATIVIIACDSGLKYLSTDLWK